MRVFLSFQRCFYKLYRETNLKVPFNVTCLNEFVSVEFDSKSEETHSGRARPLGCLRRNATLPNGVVVSQWYLDAWDSPGLR